MADKRSPEKEVLHRERSEAEREEQGVVKGKQYDQLLLPKKKKKKKKKKKEV